MLARAIFLQCSKRCVRGATSFTRLTMIIVQTVKGRIGFLGLWTSTYPRSFSPICCPCAWGCGGNVVLLDVLSRE
jgi:hypothetical protein